MKKLHFCAVWALASVVPMWASGAQKKVYVAVIGTKEYLVDTCYQDHLDDMNTQIKGKLASTEDPFKVVFISCDKDEITYPGEKETKDDVAKLVSYSFDDLNGFFNSKEAENKAKEGNTKYCYDGMQKLWFANKFLVWTMDADGNVVTQTPEVFFGKKPLQVARTKKDISGKPRKGGEPKGADYGDVWIGLVVLVVGGVLYAVGTYSDDIKAQIEDDSSTPNSDPQIGIGLASIFRRANGQDIVFKDTLKSYEKNGSKVRSGLIMRKDGTIEMLIEYDRIEKDHPNYVKEFQIDYKCTDVHGCHVFSIRTPFVKTYMRVPYYLLNLIPVYFTEYADHLHTTARERKNAHECEQVAKVECTVHWRFVN